jgi:hypothetical protein
MHSTALYKATYILRNAPTPGTPAIAPTFASEESRLAMPYQYRGLHSFCAGAHRRCHTTVVILQDVPVENQGRHQ